MYRVVTHQKNKDAGVIKIDNNHIIRLQYVQFLFDELILTMGSEAL